MKLKVHVIKVDRLLHGPDKTFLDHKRKQEEDLLVPLLRPHTMAPI